MMPMPACSSAVPCSPPAKSGLAEQYLEAFPIKLVLMRSLIIMPLIVNVNNLFHSHSTKQKQSVNATIIMPYIAYLLCYHLFMVYNHVMTNNCTNDFNIVCIPSYYFNALQLYSCLSVYCRPIYGI